MKTPKAIALPICPTDPFDQQLVAARDSLPRGHMQTWMQRLLRHHLGEQDAEGMASQMRRELLGNLEDGHKRQQRQPPKDKRLGRPAPKSEPVSSPTKSEPLGKKPDKEEELRKGNHAKSSDDAAYFA